MKLFFLLVIFFIGFRVYPQVHERNIVWEAVKKAETGGTTIHYLSFDGAAYRNLSSMLPYFVEIFPLDGDIATADIENIRYVPLNEQEQSIIAASGINAQMEISQQVLYQRKEPYLELAFIPIQKNPTSGSWEKIISFTVRITQQAGLKSSTLKRSYSSHSVLRNGEWYQIFINSDGIYKLTYDELLQIGISNPAHVRIYGYGGGMLPIPNNARIYDDLPENAIYFEKGSDGIFNKGDYILFYAKGPVQWNYNASKQLYSHSMHLYATSSSYFLTSSFGPGKTITSINSVSDAANHNVYTFDDYDFHELNTMNLIRSGKEFYEQIDVYPLYSYNFFFPNIVTTDPAKLLTKVVARSSAPSSFSFYCNGNTITSLNVSSVSLGGHTYAASSNNDPGTWFNVSQSSLSIGVSFYNPVASSSGWLDYITLNVRRHLTMHGQIMAFRDARSVGAGNISEYTISSAPSDIIVWDVTEQTNVKQVQGNLAGSTFSFRLRTDSLRKFIAFSKSATFSSVSVNSTIKVANQDLHSLSPPDMIIVTHPRFQSYAEELVNIHRNNDGLDVLVVQPDKIYNEFSSGTPDVAAIRNFLKMLYDKAISYDDIPRYLLFFGDGSYDNLSSSSSNSNLLLTYQSAESLSQTASYVSDDFFGFLDDNEGGVSGLLDIGIGRFPVQTISEAQAIIEKIKTYLSPTTMGDWRNSILFVGDDEDGNLHMSQADQLAQYVDTGYPAFNISKIYLDAFPQVATPTGQTYPSAKLLIDNKLRAGTLLFNYTGHGGELGLTHEGVISLNDILNWDNANKFPLFVTASCEFSRWDDYNRTSAGEFVLLNPQGGGIALLSTTRLVYASSNFELNKSFYKYIFERDINNNKYRLGDVVRLTKNSLGNDNNKLNFSLLGDPALALQYPDKNIITKTINGHDVIAGADTIRALEKVTIAGYVEDMHGNLQNNFNGIVYPVVYDKRAKVRTLANDGGTPFEFEIRNSILYKGKASVTNGVFSFSFIVPKDIRYNYGLGRISYYANDAATDYHGSYENFYIGGSSDNTMVDVTGPEIDLYMNEKNFAPGGITDPNPTLLAILTDSSGINTATSGIGHDLSIVIDNNTSDRIVLNEFYESELNSYQKGSLRYMFKNLSEGPHTISMKAWDVFNNSSEASIDFYVANADELQLAHIFNYPNPFTTYTEFHFDHNQPHNPLEVLIQIFTISGKLVKTIREDVVTEGYRVSSIQWDGLDDYGEKIGRGVYIYRLKVRCNGKTAEKIEKLVILR